MLVTGVLANPDWSKQSGEILKLIAKVHADSHCSLIRYLTHSVTLLPHTLSYPLSYAAFSYAILLTVLRCFLIRHRTHSLTMLPHTLSISPISQSSSKVVDIASVLIAALSLVLCPQIHWNLMHTASPPQCLVEPNTFNIWLSKLAEIYILEVYALPRPFSLCSY